MTDRTKTQEYLDKHFPLERESTDRTVEKMRSISSSAKVKPKIVPPGKKQKAKKTDTPHAIDNKKTNGTSRNASQPSNMSGSMSSSVGGNMGGSVGGNMGGSVGGNMGGIMGGDMGGNTHDATHNDTHGNTHRPHQNFGEYATPSPVYDFGSYASDSKASTITNRVHTYLARNPNVYTQYKEIALKTGGSVDHVKRIVGDLRKGGHVKTEEFYDHSLRGVHIVVLNISALQVNQNINFNTTNNATHDATHTATHNAIHYDAHTNPSKIDRSFSNNNLSVYQEKLLNLTDKDIDEMWPALFKEGFGMFQIEQILERLDKRGASADRVMKGMDHANYELEKGKVLDKEGKAVEKPLGYIFNALANTGYYRAPKGYVSPEEQALIDEKRELDRLKAMKEELEQQRMAVQEYENEENHQAWLDSMTEDEKAALVKAHRAGMAPGLRNGPSDKIVLKMIWKDMQEKQ